jgi:hypothetical protein
MQIFVQMPSGKTVSIDCGLETTVADVLELVNGLHLQGQPPVTQCLFKRAFYGEEHPMTVEPGQILFSPTRLTELYVNGVIKEITLMAF